MISVKAYGATGNGQTDDTAAITEAIKTASGEPVYFPSGTYVCNGIDLPASSVLVGDGRTSVIRLSDGADRDLLKCSHQGGTIRAIRLALNGNRAAQSTRNISVIHLYAGAELVACGCTFSGSVYSAIRIQSSVLSTAIIEQCTFSDMAEHGGDTGELSCAVSISGGGEPDILFRGNRVHGTAPSITGAAPGGLLVSSIGAKVIATDNLMRSIGQTLAQNYIGGIHLYSGASAAAISNNVFYDYQNTPIAVANSNNVVISGNVITGNPGQDSVHAIFVAYSRDYGCDISGFVINNNRICLTDRRIGIYIQGDPSCVCSVHDANVSNNSITGCSDAIYVNYMSHIYTANNIISNCENGYRFNNIVSNAMYMIVGGAISNLTSVAAVLAIAPEMESAPSLHVSALSMVSPGQYGIRASRMGTVQAVGCNCIGHTSAPFALADVGTEISLGNTWD